INSYGVREASVHNSLSWLKLRDMPYSFIFLIFSSVSVFCLTVISVSTNIVVLRHLGELIQLIFRKADRIQVFGEDLLDHRIGVYSVFRSSFAGSRDPLASHFPGEMKDA